VTRDLDFVFAECIKSRKEISARMATSTPSSSPATTNPGQIAWLALILTPGLGPTRSRRLVEFFGSVEGVLKVTLTELEAAGLPAQAAQALGTGRSVELAHDELAKASAIGISIVTLGDSAYPGDCDRFMTPRQSYIYAATLLAFRSPESRSWARVMPPHMEWAWRSGSAVI
jgi:hypothetical protein